LAIGYWLLAIGYWLLAIGYWLLAIGYWLLSICYCFLVLILVLVLVLVFWAFYPQAQAPGFLFFRDISRAAQHCSVTPASISALYPCHGVILAILLAHLP